MRKAEARGGRRKLDWLGEVVCIEGRAHSARSAGRITDREETLVDSTLGGGMREYSRPPTVPLLSAPRLLLYDLGDRRFSGNGWECNPNGRGCRAQLGGLERSRRGQDRVRLFVVADLVARALRDLCRFLVTVPGVVADCDCCALRVQGVVTYSHATRNFPCPLPLSTCQACMYPRSLELVPSMAT